MLSGALRSPFAGCVDPQQDGRTPGRPFQGTAVGGIGTMQTSASMRLKGALCSVMPAETPNFGSVWAYFWALHAFACAMKHAAALRKLRAGLGPSQDMQTTACVRH